MSKWSLKTEETEGGKKNLKREEDGFAFANPQHFVGKAMRLDKCTIAVTKTRNKIPSLELKMLRWYGIEGVYPLLPEALDGKKVKITIEVLP